MQHKIKNLPKSQVELEVTISPQEMEIFWQLAKKKTAENIKLKGFRPGKAPTGVFDDKKTQADIYNEAANLAIQKTYPEFLAEESLEPLGRVEAQVLKLAPDNEFIYRIKMAILPKFQLPDYKKIAALALKEKKPQEVKNEEIKEGVKWLQKLRSQIKAVERPAQKGDLVEAEINSFVGQKSLSKTTNPESFILGEGHFLPGLEEQIEGLKAGERKNFQLKVPADYWDEALRNKELSFEVKINKVKERKLPEVNDEWAKSIGSFNTLEELEKSIGDGLKFEKEMKERDRLRVFMMERILKETEIDLPEILVENEMNHRLHEISHLAEDIGLSLEEYLKKINKNESQLREDLKGEAEKTLKSVLTLKEIARLKELQPKTEEIETAMNEFLKHHHDLKEAEKNIDRAAFFEYTKERLTNEKVFQFLENIQS